MLAFDRVPWCGRIAFGGAERLVRSASFAYPDAGSATCAGWIDGSEFEFLGDRRKLEGTIDWNPHGASLLWRFHLNYFDWAPRLATANLAALDGHVSSWIVQNRIGRQPPWHPYPTSLRVVNWIRAIAAAGLDRPEWERSLALQAAFVEANLEKHLGGNHFIENAFALLVAGYFFDGDLPRRWRELGLRLLLEQLDAQVLPDGGHYERSLSYHFRVNLVCRETIRLMSLNGATAPGKLLETDAKMERFLLQLCHEDGDIPLFHDSQLIGPEQWQRFQRLRPNA